MSVAFLLLIIAAAAAWVLFMSRPALVAARMFQIEEYERTRFLGWGIGARWTAHRAVMASSAIGALSLLLVAFTGGNRAAPIAAGWCAGSLVGAVVWTWLPPKKALVFTARMRRLLSVAAAAGCMVAAVEAVLLWNDAWIAAGVLLVIPLSFASGSAQLLLIAADLLLVPVEAQVRRGYLWRAGARLAAVHPRVVSVVGSYGKTSTKHILAHCLASADVLPTRKSFNTLMGVTRVINEDLRDSHRMFIVEMDAYGPGEIASMCRLVHPTVAVVTAVGPQHLERFHTMDRVVDALYEGVAALPNDGTAIIFAGDAATSALAGRARAEGRTVVTYGIATEGAGFDVEASEVTSDATGSRFTWRWAARQRSCSVTIPLLGAHQVLNTTAALAAVDVLGADLETAVAAAATLEPVEHRMQVLRTGGPLTVIDDSYNANPVGVHNALDVLAQMSGGRKILVTPGLVELGALEEAENRRYGEHAARVCDEVIVMDARPAAPLRAGLAAGGLAPERIHVVQSLSDATAVIGSVSRAGDVVLFANDLPDTYLSG